MEIIDPRKLKEEDLPLIVLSDGARSFFNFITKLHQKGNYGHIMEMLKPGVFASQNWTFREVPVEKYTNAKTRLKFWSIKDLPEWKKDKLYDLAEKRLALPWYKKRYDFLGIFGQLTHLTRINNPYIMYCSEQVSHDLRQIGYIMPLKPSPSDLNKIFEQDERFDLKGYWIK